MSSSNAPGKSSAEATSAQTGWRSDRALCALVPNLGRRAAKAIFHGQLVRLNGKIATGAERIVPGDRFTFPNPDRPGENPIQTAKAPRLVTPHGRQIARLYEDADLLVLNKPSEIPVHRGQGGSTRRDTLEDVMERAYPAPAHAAPGAQGYYFVHRLDMETSGCLLVAKTQHSYEALVEAFANRQIKKEYLAVVYGEVKWDEIVIKNPITYIKAGQKKDPHAYRARPLRHKPPMRAEKMAVVLEEGDPEGKSAETHFQVLERYKGYTLLRADPKTGRTHQIRVHLLKLGHPMAYDPVYGRDRAIRYRDLDPRTAKTPQGDEVILNRLPLHAFKVGFQHPGTGAEVSFEAPLPRDLSEFLHLLKKLRSR